MAKEILNQHLDDTNRHIPTGVGSTGQVLAKAVSGYTFVDLPTTSQTVATGATVYAYNNIGGAF
jgi:hypothetical protein